MAGPENTVPKGPFPPSAPDTEEGRDEYDRLRRRVMWSLPYGLYIVGSRAGDRRNGMTLNWATQISFEPKLVGIGVEKSSLTHELIVEGGVFTLNTVAREDRDHVRKFTRPVEVDEAAMTLNGFGFHDGLSGAPILDASPGYLDCRVTQSLDAGTHTFFVGEVIDAAFLGSEDTEVLRMEDTRMNYGG